MKIKQLLVFVLFCSIGLFGSAQLGSISGSVQDTKSNEALIGAKVILTNSLDSNFRKGAFVDPDGNFKIENVDFGSYKLTISMMSYADFELPITLNSVEIKTGILYLSKDVQLINEVEVETKMIRVEQNGDTTAYNADAYKTNPDATIEELVGKMPGITVENGVVKSNGEEIKKVLINGEEFFGDDATAALKNLPAEIVSRIQVFDKQSDQAQFTGVNDGNETKALNIVTKPGKNNGQFGKIYAGYGTDNHYLAGANVNFFKGVRKFSIIGMSNNVNQQNFSSEDILGVQGTNANSQPGRGPNSSTADNFLIGQQNGISQTHSIGLNYSDKWGAKTKVTGSYFFNASKNDNKQVTDRTYILANNSGQLYNENYDANSTNSNHRLNFKFDIMLDSNNTIMYSPRASVQVNNSGKITNGFTQDANASLINQIANNYGSDNVGYTVNNDLLWRHKFSKPKRTFSTELKTQFNNKDNSASQYSNSSYYVASGDSVVLIDQNSNGSTKGYSISSKFSYTEPIGKNMTGELYYEPNYTYSDADKRTNDFNEVTNDYSTFDTTLSNVFKSKTLINQAGTNFRYNKEKITVQIGASYQNTNILNDQTFPLERNVNLIFNNILPSGFFKYEFSKTNALRLFYRTQTRTPSIDQLQNVIDNSNPLSLKSGNPSLKQQYNHRLFLRYNATNTAKASSFFVYISGEYYQNYISNSTIVATNDTIVNGNTPLSRGSQYTQPVNLNGSWNTSAFVSYGIPLGFIKTNLNLNAGAGYTVNPGLVNNSVNNSNTTNLNGGITLSSNISEKIDFTLSYAINYNDVKNSSQSKSNNTYFIQNGNARINWMPWARLVINTNFTLSSYAGLGASFNRTISLWNAGIGYKILKQKQLELRVSVFDLLNQNNSIARNVTSSYIEDVQSTVLKRYYMFTATWTLRNFKAKEQK